MRQSDIRSSEGQIAARLTAAREAQGKQPINDADPLRLEVRHELRKVATNATLKLLLGELLTVCRAATDETLAAA